MSGAASRGDRRRRVLNEEVLSASREYASYDSKDAEATSPGRRFALTPGDLSESLVTKVFPRSHWFTVALMAMLALASGLLVAADNWKQTLADAIGTELLPLIDSESSQSASTWFVGALLATSAAVCACVLVVRRCRSDDFKGSYRRWTLACAGCIALTLLHITKIHQIAAIIAANLTGFRLLDGAIWWLAPATVVGGWMAWRMFRELSESRVSITFFTLATGSAIVAVTTSLTGVAAMPAALAATPTALYLAAPALLLASLVAYTRHIASQVFGGATVRRLKVVAEPATTTPKATAKSTTTRTLSKAENKTDVAARANSASDNPTPSIQWTDGSDGVEDDAAGESRKLTKAERKRMRRLQQQNHAA